MTGLLRKFSVLPIALLGVGLMPATSRADLTITLGNPGGGLTTLNIDQPTGTLATSFTAGTNTLGTVMNIDLGGVQGKAGGTGQAAISSTDTAFSQVTFSAVAPYTGWETFVVNPGFTVNSGSFTVTGYDNNLQSVTETFTITSGQNFFNIQSSNMQFISSVVLTTSPPLINEIAQIRVDGPRMNGGPTPGVVPEPSTLALAIGCIAPLAVIGLRRRRKAVADAA